MRANGATLHGVQHAVGAVLRQGAVHSGVPVQSVWQAGRQLAAGSSRWGSWGGEIFYPQFMKLGSRDFHFYPTGWARTDWDTGLLVCFSEALNSIMRVGLGKFSHLTCCVVSELDHPSLVVLLLFPYLLFRTRSSSDGAVRWTGHVFQLFFRPRRSDLEFRPVHSRRKTPQNHLSLSHWLKVDIQMQETSVHCGLFFPSLQEPGSHKKIKQFVQRTMSSDVDLFQKTSVNGGKTHPLFRWLKEHCPGKELPGHHAVQKGVDIDWNFAKFLVDQDGRPIGRWVVEGCRHSTIFYSTTPRSRVVVSIEVTCTLVVFDGVRTASTTRSRTSL